MSAHPLFEVVRTTTGAISIRNKQVNEIMHNPVGPWLEANRLYIDQSRLRDRLNRQSADQSADCPGLIVFDVGLGAAANALAVMHCLQSFEAGSKRRRVQLISYERDLSLLEFALDHSKSFDHFLGFEIAIRKLLDQGSWENNLGDQWLLRHGDFNELIIGEALKADLVFFDPYSPKVNSEMWSYQTFRSLRSCMHLDIQYGPGLLTYSQATSVRSSLLAAGFFVGFGASTGKKEHTTQAAVHLQDLDSPLDLRWLERWQRSHIPFPEGSSDLERIQLREQIEKHPQFQAPLV